MIERSPWPLLCAALCAAALASPVSAEMYKWRDAAGQVHYSESPPPGQPAETIKPPPKVDPTRAREALDREIEKFDIRADERHDQEAHKKAAEDKENQMACEEARHQAESLADKPRSYRTESDGTRIIQTDEEHQASIAKRRAWIALHCKP